MRILLLNQFFWPDSAATSQFLTDLARGLACPWPRSLRYQRRRRRLCAGRSLGSAAGPYPPRPNHPFRPRPARPRLVLWLFLSQLFLTRLDRRAPGPGDHPNYASAALPHRQCAQAAARNPALHLGNGRLSRCGGRSRLLQIRRSARPHHRISRRLFAPPSRRHPGPRTLHERPADRARHTRREDSHRRKLGGRQPDSAGRAQRSRRPPRLFSIPAISAWRTTFRPSSPPCRS